MLVRYYSPRQSRNCAFQCPKHVQSYVRVGAFDFYIGRHSTHLLQLGKCRQARTS